MSDTATPRENVFAAAPGLAVTEALFASLDDVVFCVKNRRFQYVAANDAFVRRVTGTAPTPAEVAVLRRAYEDVADAERSA